MRQIKFKAWDKEKKVMIEYNPIMSFRPFHITPDGYVYKNGVVQSYILLQYIGLKDRNEKEIYEGDIIEECKVGEKIWEDRTAEGIVVSTPKGKVYYSAPYFNVRTDVVGIVDGDIKVLYLDAYDTIYQCWEDCKVIGNIYENPELLNVK